MSTFFSLLIFAPSFLMLSQPVLASDGARPRCYGQAQQLVKSLEFQWDDINRPFPPASGGPKYTFQTRVDGDPNEEVIVYQMRAKHVNIYGQTWTNPYRLEFDHQNCTIKAYRFYGTEGEFPRAG